MEPGAWFLCGSHPILKFTPEIPHPQHARSHIFLHTRSYIFLHARSHIFVNMPEATYSPRSRILLHVAGNGWGALLLRPTPQSTNGHPKPHTLNTPHLFSPQEAIYYTLNHMFLHFTGNGGGAVLLRAEQRLSPGASRVAGSGVSEDRRGRWAISTMSLPLCIQHREYIESRLMMRVRYESHVKTQNFWGEGLAFGGVRDIGRVLGSGLWA